MSKSKKFIVGVVMALVVIVLLLQIDDELSPDATAMLEAIDWQTSSDAYLYLLGMGAELGREPLDEGREVLADIRRHEDAYDEMGSYDEFPAYPHRPSLKLPHYDAFCNAYQEHCIRVLFNGSDVPLDSPLMVAVKERYLTFLNMGGFRTLTKPHIFEPFPLYSPLIRGNRLSSLSAIEQAKACCPEAAMNELYDLIGLQKRHISETDNLIGRMIAYVLLNETIDVLSALMREFDLQGRKIEMLSRGQLSFDNPMNREFGLLQSGMTTVRLSEDFNRFPGWMLQLVHKPNISTNAFVPVYQHIKMMSELPQLRFAEEVGASQQLKLQKSWVRNIAGTILNGVAKPDFEEYVARGFDLNAKIALFNGQLNKPLSSQTLQQIPNPYYSEGHYATLSQDGDRVCFDGPLEDTKYIRCLTILNDRTSEPKL